MSPETKIFFINKTAQSKVLTRSERTEKFKIFSHVQKLPSSRGTCSSLSTGLHFEAHNFGDSLSRGTTDKPRNRKRLPSSGKVVRDKDQAERQHAPPNLHPTSPLQVVSINNDPSSRAAVPMDPYMNAVLNFYCSSLLHMVFPIACLADVARKYTLAHASENAIVLYTVLYTASGAIHLRTGDPTHGYRSMYFKGQAIHHLKHSLLRADGASPSVATVYAVSLLLWIECIQGNVDDVQAHIRGLERMVATTDGISASPLPILTSILACSYYCSATLAARPVLLPPSYDENDRASKPNLDALSKCFETESKFQKVASRFFTTSNEGLIGPRLFRLITEQRKFVLFKELCFLGRLAPCYEDVQSMYATKMAFEHQLLSMPFEQSAAEPLTPEQDAVRLALYIFGQPAISVSKPTSAFNRSMAKQLRSALERTEMSTLWGPSSDLLLWILFIASRLSYGQEEWTWIVANMAVLSNLMNIESKQQMEDILAGFYFSPEHFAGTLQNVWNDVKIMPQAPRVWFAETG